MRLVRAPFLPSRAAGIALGVLGDAAFGDPRRAHPVAAFGRWAGVLERVGYAPTRRRGVAYTTVAITGPVLIGVAAERVAARRPVLGTVITALATWAALGGTSLARESRAMADALDRGDLPAARDRLTHLCARDPARLSPAELARATVESMAENSSDAVLAPLFWATVAGIPGVLGYRAVNTLDAMVGYRSQRYATFGWASARLDDLVNLAPARLTGVITAACAPLVGGSPVQAWRVLRSDHGRHPSPNAGHCEASAAGALGIQLGGVNVYTGSVEGRPLIGEGGRAPDAGDIRRAVRLERMVGWVGAGLAVAGALAIALGRSARRRPGPERSPSAWAGAGMDRSMHRWTPGRTGCSRDGAVMEPLCRER
jgi:adenosylcobinamide-phosphate synthase